MGLEKLLSEQHENKLKKKQEVIENLKSINRKSSDTKDIVKRLEVIEKFLGLE